MKIYALTLIFITGMLLFGCPQGGNPGANANASNVTLPPVNDSANGPNATGNGTAANATGNATVGANATGAPAEGRLLNLTLATDKASYRGTENVHASLTIETSGPIAAAAISVVGVKTAKGYYVMQKTETKPLAAGTNNFSYAAQLPACSTCSGLYPGDYTITANVTAGNESLSKDVRVVVQK